MRAGLDTGVIHFIGIGGIGMSAIAEALHKLGYKVQGSDQAENANIKRLRALSVPVFIGHKAENIKGAKVVVVSSAICKDNVEYKTAKENSIPVIKRAEMLAELMRFRQSIVVAGTHGKTTTTSLIGTILEKSGFDPTVINGGIINAYGTNARLGDGDWMVVEGDESDGSFLKLPKEIAVITNIDPEHLEHYGDFDRLRQAFKQFVETIPFYGFAVLCIDHEEVKKLSETIEDRRLITYGSSEEADVQFIVNEPTSSGSCFDVVIKDQDRGGKVIFSHLSLPMIGRHNISNATAAVAVAYGLGIGYESIKEGLLSFGGVKRRFTHVGAWQGVEIFDDYGHHPVEIKAVLKAAQENKKGRIIAVVQPHRFTRLRDLFSDFASCFQDADIVLLAPVYAAGEHPIENVNSSILADHMRQCGHKAVQLVGALTEVASFIREHGKEGDYVIFLGAGDITKWAYDLPVALSSCHDEDVSRIAHAGQ